MAQVSLTDFIDFLSRSGTPRLTLVRRSKKRQQTPYSPQVDFYKPLRDTLLRLHKNELPRSTLDDVVKDLSDTKKQAAYPALVEGYKRFLGRKHLKYFKPPTGTWSSGGLTVSINPELGLVIDGKKHVVKLYFKADRLTKLRADAMLQLMEAVLGEKGGPWTFGVLDVRNARLVTSAGFNASLMRLLEAEAQSFESIYDQTPLE